MAGLQKAGGNMKLDRNNNKRVLYRVAINNILSNKLSGFFSAMAIFLVVMLVSVITLYITNFQYADRQAINKMQHVIYMDTSIKQAGNMARDKTIEEAVLYKTLNTRFKTNGTGYHFTFFGNNSSKIETYKLQEGKAPQKYNEIAASKSFMEALGIEARPGTRIILNTGNMEEEFIVSGITDSKTPVPEYIIYVSGEFANKSPVMKDIQYNTLVRFNNVSSMEISLFTTLVYQTAVNYGIKRQNVSINGKLEESLQSGNSGLYTILTVAILLFLASSIVVYSIFYSTAVSRIKQTGQLITIGMTHWQVKKMVHIEGFTLSIFSIPPGLFLSGVIAYLLLPSGWNWGNYIIICLAVGIAESFIVQISVSKPASIAAKVSPVSAARGINSEIKEISANRQHRFLSPYTLAITETRNNKKRWWITTASLAFGGILFMAAATWNFSWDKEGFSRQSVFKNCEYYISYLYNHSIPKTYGITDMQLRGHMDKKLTEEIKNIPGVKDVLAEKSATGVIEYQGSTFTQPFYPLNENDYEYFQISAKGNNTYKYMAKNDAILVTGCSFTEKINGISFKPGDKLTLKYFDGREHSIELEIGAISTEYVAQDTNRPTFCMADVTMAKLWGEMNTTDSLYISVENYKKNGRAIEEEIKKITGNYEDLSLYTLREQILEDGPSIKTNQLQIYGISIFIILFSLFNLANTVISSITARKRELTLLEAAGMEEWQKAKMLLWESFLLVLPNIIITLTAGSLAGAWFINFMQNTATYLKYRFPLSLVILYISIIIFVPVCISLICLKEQTKTPLAERIKNYN